MSKTMVGTTGPKDKWPIAVRVRPNGNIEAFFMANWIVNVVVEPCHGDLVEKNISADKPGFRWLLDAARDYLRTHTNPTLAPQTQGEPMAAKVVVTKREAPSQRVYPWVGVHPQSGTIVWFIHATFGTVIGRDATIQSITQGSDIGSGLHTWTADEFKEFTGTVTISN